MEMASVPKGNESYQSLAMMISKVFKIFEHGSSFQCNVMACTSVSPKTPAFTCMLRWMSEC